MIEVVLCWIVGLAAAAAVFVAVAFVVVNFSDRLIDALEGLLDWLDLSRRRKR